MWETTECVFVTKQGFESMIFGQKEPDINNLKDWASSIEILSSIERRMCQYLISRFFVLP